VRSSYETKKEENTLQTEELLNPSRVAFLEREYKQLLQNYEQTWDEDKKKAIQVKLKKVERNLELEKRSLMTRGLRNVFIAQAVFSLIVGGLLASNKFPYIADVPLVLRTTIIFNRFVVKCVTHCYLLRCFGFLDGLVIYYSFFTSPKTSCCRKECAKRCLCRMSSSEYSDSLCQQRYFFALVCECVPDH